MKTFALLKNELCKECDGIFAPYLFYFEGYKEDMSAPPPQLFSNGIYSLFASPKPVILKNEWIAGNLKCLYVTKDEEYLRYARSVTDRVSKRGFSTNSDHFSPNYEKVLELGIVGLIEQTEKSLCLHRDDEERVQTLLSMKKTLCGFWKMAENYAAAAKACLTDPQYDREKLKFIIDNCTAVTKHAPQTFAQALQLVWLCHTAFLMEERFAMALGRMDKYLYPFYIADIKAGRITDEKVTELLENVFIKLAGDTINICIGGQNINGECEINGLSYCILNAVKSCNIPGPNLSLRLTENTPDEFLDKCLEVIGTGLGYPAIMNDSVNVAALKKYGYADEDICDYSMVGCIENFITGKQPPWSDGRFDTPRFFDFVFFNGKSKTNGSFGIDTGDVENISSMAEFMSAFEKQLVYGAQEYYLKFQSRNDSINQKYYPQPFLSCFCDDCIGRGLDINCGGSKYPSVHGVAVMGIATTADSLAAIEKVVFVDKSATLTDIKNALESDFEGYEQLREKLLLAPKYGNNDNFADKYAIWFIDFLSSVFENYKTRDGGPFYIAAAANISNIYAGKTINATPDGRKRKEPLSDAASPTYGKDSKGATSTLLSLSKPDYTKVACGSVVNQKFSPAMFKGEKRQKLIALIRTYFKKGGQEIQINATSRETLIDAMQNPEKYQNLIVRVSGFSAFYVTLDKDVQLDILNRTEQE